MADLGVIFDMDGVLADTTEIITEVHQGMLRQYGVQLSPQEVRDFVGRSLRDNVKIWNQQYGLSLDLSKYTTDSWAIQSKLLEKLNPDAGLVYLLEELRYHKIPMGVGTNSMKFRSDRIFDVLSFHHYFSAQVTANEVKEHKPNPAVFLEVARRLGVAPQRCAVIGDAGNDIEAAINGGMKAIGYLNGHNSEEELKRAHLIFRSFAELNYERIVRLF